MAEIAQHIITIIHFGMDLAGMETILPAEVMQTKQIGKALEVKYINMEQCI